MLNGGVAGWGLLELGVVTGNGALIWSSLLVLPCFLIVFSSCRHTMVVLGAHMTIAMRVNYGGLLTTCFQLQTFLVISSYIQLAGRSISIMMLRCVMTTIWCIIPGWSLTWVEILGPVISRVANLCGALRWFAMILFGIGLRFMGLDAIKVGCMTVGILFIHSTPSRC